MALDLRQNVTATRKSRPLDFFDWNAINFGTDIVGAPTSPDSVCLDKSVLITHEPLTLDQGMLTFDPNMFANERTTSTACDLDMFRFLEAISAGSDEDSHTDSTDYAQSSPEPSAIGSEEIVPTKATLKPKKKRTKSFSSESFDDDTDFKPKKLKAAPRHPRSRLPTSAYRGVSRCTKDGRWQARIRIAKEVVYLGRFPTEEQAARRYDEAARLHHGAAAMLNFVTQDDIDMGRKSVFSEKHAA